ncbi:MAG: hypothetical protein JSR31_12080 [Nitrospira sp.]|nr:hypothetical protein [Nitrospira sp.]
MTMHRINIQLPAVLKRQIDAQRKRSISAAGLIRHLLEQHFQQGAQVAYHTNNQGGIKWRR